MISRRAFVAIVVTLPLAARAQPKTHRIGYLLLTPLVDPPSAERAAFLAALRNLGYIDGKNLRIEYRSADGSRPRLDALAEELVRAKVDVIIAPSTPSAQAAQQATRTVPIVMLGIGDAQRAKLVTNYARPEANVTGVTWLQAELIAKRFQLLKETLPRAVRVGMVRNPGDASEGEQYSLGLQAVQQLGLKLHDYPVSGTEQLQLALERAARERPDALFVIPDSRIVTYRKIIADEALKQRIPCFSSYRGFVDAGALMSYAADLTDLYRRGAAFVARLLQGATVAELPVEQPSRFQLVLNLKTAKALGLKIPHSVMVLADEVIE
jgi:putative tryptophan/tyrosine transport system substrate-binding protein